MISIIIPIYNAEKYIAKCIDSVLSQSYNDFELILVDDGSTDSSLEICKQYALKDTRIKLLKKQNGGVSSARNYGIKNSKGEWITFIDSDDYIGKDFLEKLIPTTDLIYDFSLANGFTRNKEIKQFFPNTPITNISLEKMIESICGEKGLCLAPWGKLFKREIIITHNIQFIEGLSFCEDLIFNFQYFKYIKNNIFVGDDTSYYYRENENSLTHKIVNYKQVLKAIEPQFADFLYYKKHFPQNDIIIKHFVFTITNCVLRVAEQVFRNKDLNNNEMERIFNQCKHYTQFTQVETSLLTLPFTQNIKFQLIKKLPFKVVKIIYAIK